MGLMVISKKLSQLAMLSFSLVAFASFPKVSAQEVQQSCSEDENFRQQDFTLGHWDVFSGKDKVAEVLMEPVLKDCAIFETWTTVGGRPGNGLGLFTYSRLLGDWGYFWAADTGSATSFRGHSPEPGEMLFITYKPAPDGARHLRHWTLSLQPDGAVRELSRRTEDQGKSWVTEYDLMWVKKQGE